MPSEYKWVFSDTDAGAGTTPEAICMAGGGTFGAN
jgi:hypothetical protein